MSSSGFRKLSPTQWVHTTTHIHAHVYEEILKQDEIIIYGDENNTLVLNPQCYKNNHYYC